MKVECEHELNRAWVYADKGDDPIGETNFVVSTEWLVDLYKNEYSNEYESFDEFMDLYEPEVDGECIYRKAIQDKVLKEDLGVVLY